MKIWKIPGRISLKNYTNLRINLRFSKHFWDWHCFHPNLKLRVCLAICLIFQQSEPSVLINRMLTEKKCVHKLKPYKSNNDDQNHFDSFIKHLFSFLVQRLIQNISQLIFKSNSSVEWEKNRIRYNSKYQNINLFSIKTNLVKIWNYPSSVLEDWTTNQY